MAGRTEAQRRRAEARERRRTAGNGDGEVTGEPREETDVRSAARAAAAAAAYGVTLGAARALGARAAFAGGGETGTETGEPGDDQQDAEDARDLEPREPEPAAEHEPVGDDPDEREDAPGATAGPDDVARIVAQAGRHLEALQGRPVESVSGFEAIRDGWTVSLEVVELSRVPDTTDVLATYEVVLDRDCNLRRYARRRRYHRADAGTEEER